MVIWSDPAKADLHSIHDFIAKSTLHYAKKVVQDIRKKADTFDFIPNKGTKTPELNDDNVRERSLYSYRIIYEIKQPDIFILAVIHKRRNLEESDIKRA
jgi:plasmid stabilization system protein ParE